MNKVDQWSWLYACLRPWVQFVFRLVHKEIKIIGLENIPRNQAVVYAPNHQNALMDALAIVYSTPGQTVFLSRADIFRKKITASVLHFFKLLPVYRIRDGKGSLDKNEEIYSNVPYTFCKKNSRYAFSPKLPTPTREACCPIRKPFPVSFFWLGKKPVINLIF